jgi:alpha-galactosidase
MLSRCQLQSISDQDDYRKYASLTTGSSAVVLPEQLGVWSQPLEHSTPEAAACNMVNTMLGRIHQSGYITRLSPAALKQVRNGIAVYKQQIRRHIPHATPFYPVGMPDVSRPTEPAALGMRSPDRSFLAVWRRSGPAQVRVPGRFASADLLYPTDLNIRTRAASDSITVTFPAEDMGCILAL